MKYTIFRKGYRAILLSIALLFLLVSVQLSIPVASKTNYEYANLSFKISDFTEWHEWTRNPEFNSNGAYWVARTWKWHITGDNKPGGPYDQAYFTTCRNDYCLYAKSFTLNDGYTHCAGATQGWIWDYDPPNAPDHINQHLTNYIIDNPIKIRNEIYFIHTSMDWYLGRTFKCLV